MKKKKKRDRWDISPTIEELERRLKERAENNSKTEAGKDNQQDKTVTWEVKFVNNRDFYPKEQEDDKEHEGCMKEPEEKYVKPVKDTRSLEEKLKSRQESLERCRKLNEYTRNHPEAFIKWLEDSEQIPSDRE